MATLDLGNIGSFKLTPSSVTACTHPDHNPPQHVTTQPGGYSWRCPECGYSFTCAVAHPCENVCMSDEEEEDPPPIRIGEDGHLTMRSGWKPCVPVSCPPERFTLLGVPEGETGVRLPPRDLTMERYRSDFLPPSSAGSDKT